MANSNTAGNTPAKVARLATDSDALDLGGLTLIGLFGPVDDLSALVREPSGRFRRVKHGQKLAAGRVVGIDSDGLMLEKSGRTWRLDLPG